jgi:hypothetical protein
MKTLNWQEKQAVAYCSGLAGYRRGRVIAADHAPRCNALAQEPDTLRAVLVYMEGGEHQVGRETA